MDNGYKGDSGDKDSREGSNVQRREMICLSSALEKYGITKRILDRFLPNPVLRDNPYGRSRPKMKLYYADEIEKLIRENDEVREMMDKHEKKRKISLKSVDTKMKKMEEKLKESVEKIKVDTEEYTRKKKNINYDIDYDRLENDAIEHYNSFQYFKAERNGYYEEPENIIDEKELRDKIRKEEEKEEDKKEKKEDNKEYRENKVNEEWDKEEIKEGINEEIDNNVININIVNEYRREESNREFLDRITVNYIRHELTEYDENLWNNKGKTGCHMFHHEYKKAVLDKIAEKYGRYREECERQKKRLDSAMTDSFIDKSDLN